MIGYVYKINCDCSSYWDIRKRPVSFGWPRCRCCKRPLGDMQAEYIGRFEGEDASDIIAKAKSSRDT